jgi:hypothetical protein
MRAQGRAPGCARAQGVRHGLRFGAGQRAAARRSALRSPVRRHGRRWTRRPHSGASTHVRKRRPRTRCFFLLATVRASHKATAGSQRRHGGAAVLGTAASGGVGTNKGPKARPCLQGYGARVLGCTLASAAARTGARADAHATRTRRGRTDTVWRQPNGAASYG